MSDDDKIGRYNDAEGMRAAKEVLKAARKYLDRDANDVSIDYAIEVWRHRHVSGGGPEPADSAN